MLVGCRGLFPCIVSVPALPIGHSFGIIPAPGSFASSAFPVPPKKQPLALGAAASRFRVPQLKGQGTEEKIMHVNVVRSIGYLLAELRGSMDGVATIRPDLVGLLSVDREGIPYRVVERGIGVTEAGHEDSRRIVEYLTARPGLRNG